MDRRHNLCKWSVKNKEGATIWKISKTFKYYGSFL